MNYVIPIMGSIMALIIVILAISCCIASSRADEALDDIDFEREEWKHPFL